MAMYGISMKLTKQNNKAACNKYRNPHGTVFIWCKVANGTEHISSYIRCFTDPIDDYYVNYNYCPYCGDKLEVKDEYVR